MDIQDFHPELINSIPQARIILEKLKELLTAVDPGSSEEVTALKNAVFGETPDDPNALVNFQQDMLDNAVLSEAVRNIVVLTQEEYDALTSYDENTMYNII